MQRFLWGSISGLAVAAVVLGGLSLLAPQPSGNRPPETPVTALAPVAGAQVSGDPAGLPAGFPDAPAVVPQGAALEMPRAGEPPVAETAPAPVPEVQNTVTGLALEAARRPQARTLLPQTADPVPATPDTHALLPPQTALPPVPEVDRTPPADPLSFALALAPLAAAVAEQAARGGEVSLSDIAGAALDLQEEAAIENTPEAESLGETAAAFSEALAPDATPEERARAEAMAEDILAAAALIAALEAEEREAAVADGAVPDMEGAGDNADSAAQEDSKAEEDKESLTPSPDSAAESDLTEVAEGPDAITEPDTPSDAAGAPGDDGTPAPESPAVAPDLAAPALTGAEVDAHDLAQPLPADETLQTGLPQLAADARPDAVPETLPEPLPEEIILNPATDAEDYELIGGGFAPPPVVPATPVAAETAEAGEAGETPAAVAANLPATGSAEDDADTATASQDAAPPAQEPAPANPAVTDALHLFAAPPVDAAGKPLLSVVMIDDGSMMPGMVVLGSIGFPVTVVLSPDRPDAAEMAATYRAAGFEVAVLADAKGGDAAAATAAGFAALPETVALVDLGEAGLDDPAARAAILDYLSAAGRGLAWVGDAAEALGAEARVARVPAVPILRDLDGAGQDAATIRRFLENAAIRAGQEGEAVVLTRLKPDTLTALSLWTTAPRAAEVAMAPLSMILQAQ